MKLCGIYLHRDVLYMWAYSKTEMGVRIHDGKVRSVSIKDDDVSIGRVLVETLSESRVGIPHPDNAALKRLFDQLLQLAGVKSYSRFSSDTQSVLVQVDENRYKFIPSRRLDKGRGFTNLEDKAMEVQTGEFSALGSALRKTLELCE